MTDYRTDERVKAAREDMLHRFVSHVSDLDALCQAVYESRAAAPQDWTEGELNVAQVGERSGNAILSVKLDAASALSHPAASPRAGAGEPVAWPLATGDDAKGGWHYSTAFLQELNNDIERRGLAAGYDLCMEQVEGVVRALADRSPLPQAAASGAKEADSAHRFEPCAHGNHPSTCLPCAKLTAAAIPRSGAPEVDVTMKDGRVLRVRDLRNAQATDAEKRELLARIADVLGVELPRSGAEPMPSGRASEKMLRFIDHVELLIQSERETHEEGQLYRAVKATIPELRTLLAAALPEGSGEGTSRKPGIADVHDLANEYLTREPWRKWTDYQASTIRNFAVWLFLKINPSRVGSAAPTRADGERDGEVTPLHWQDGWLVKSDANDPGMISFLEAKPVGQLGTWTVERVRVALSSRQDGQETP